MSAEKLGVGLTGLSCWKGLGVLQQKAFCVSLLLSEKASNTAKQYYSKSASHPSVSLPALTLALAEPLKCFSSLLHRTWVAGRLQHKKPLWAQHHSLPLKSFLPLRQGLQHAS